MASFLIGLMILLLLNSSKAPQNFETVSECPSNASSWKMKSDKKDCKGDTPNYLCAAIENHVGKYGEICTQYGLTSINKCAVLNAQTHNLDSVDCKAASGCPQDPYIPSELWKYPICFKDFYGTKTTMAIGTTQTIVVTDNVNRSGNAGSGAGVAIAVVIILIIVVVVVVLVVFYVRNQFGFKDKLHKSITDVRNRLECFQHRDDTVEHAPDVRNRLECFQHRDGTVEHAPDEEAGVAEADTKKPLLNDTYMEPFHRFQVLNEQFSLDNKDLSWKLTALKYYLVVILKHFSGIEELKDVPVIFKTSLLQHFKESVLENLNNLNSWDDYQKLDMSLVYNLLRNVCKHISPPNRGWGYDPPPDDLSLGADIERIRSIWNNYCDGETEFVYMNDIFVRMFDVFGTIFKDVEVQDFGGEKISSVELKPECVVIDKVVITKAIKLVLDSLKKETFVIVKGAIGSGKSTCLKYVDEHYRGNQWEVKWKEEIITPSDLYVQENKKLLLCCDNLFGAYNRGQFASTSEIIEALENLEKEGDGELKVILAIHDHVYDELLKSLNIKALQNKRVVADFNEFSDAEMLLIFNDQRKRGHCTRDRRCPFRDVDFRSIQGTLKGNPGQIGDPLLTLLYSNFHDIYNKNEATQNLVKELYILFQIMLDESPELFHILLYIMIMGTHKLKNKLPHWAVELEGVNNEKVEQNVCHLDAFLVGRIDGQGLQMKHDFFSFALFKFCADHTKYQHFLLQHCQFSMIEEIMRPVSSPTQSDFCVILKDKMIPLLVSRIVGENLHMFMKSHPLMENLEFRALLKNKSSPDVWKAIV